MADQVGSEALSEVSPAQMTENRRPGAVIIGASSGIGAALARALALRGYAVALVARRLDELERVADAINRELGAGDSSPRARAYQHDVRAPDEAPALFERIARDFGAGRLRAVIYAAGILPPGADGHWTFAEERDTLETNLLGAVRWLDLGADELARRGTGTLVGISSVAGDRGRKGNSAYMASKAALSTYLESLRYRLRARGVRVVTVKPGYVATPMTAGASLPQALVAPADAVARRIARVIDHGPSVLYVPGYWAPAMWVVRHLPAAIMARLNI